MFFRRSKKDNLWIIAGLGNPGKKYEKTRHNIGFEAIDSIAKELAVQPKRLRFHALTAEGEICGTNVLLMKPQTMMNLSGNAIAEAAHFYNVPAERVIVICDDINLSAGTVRIKDKGSAGGHNGLKDIIAKLGSENFFRIRVGAGKMISRESMPDWVLSQPSAADKKAIESRHADIFKAIELIIDGKLSEAQSKYNK